MEKKATCSSLDQIIIEKILNYLPVAIHLLEVIKNSELMPVWDNGKYQDLYDCSCDKFSSINIDSPSKQYDNDDQLEVKHAYHYLIENIGNEIGLFCRIKKNNESVWVYIKACSVELLPNRAFIVKVIFPIEEKEVYNQLKIEEYVKELKSLCQRVYISKLSKSELVVFNLLGQGYSTKEIADKLCRSYNTINNHRKSIFKKLNVHKIQDLQIMAMNNY